MLCSNTFSAALSVPCTFPCTFQRMFPFTCFCRLMFLGRSVVKLSAVETHHAGKGVAPLLINMCHLSMISCVHTPTRVYTFLHGLHMTNTRKPTRWTEAAACSVKDNKRPRILATLIVFTLPVLPLACTSQPGGSNNFAGVINGEAPTLRRGSN